MAVTGLRGQCGRLFRRVQQAIHQQARCGTAHGAAWSQAAPMSASSGDPSAQREQEIAQLLRDRMPGVKAVRVQDTSGGCGSMYRIEVAADEFKGQSIVKQHQLVTKALEDEIPKWHGFVLDTRHS